MSAVVATTADMRTVLTWLSRGYGEALRGIVSTYWFEGDDQDSTGALLRHAYNCGAAMGRAGKHLLDAHEADCIARD
jgi:hypothetical protein